MTTASQPRYFDRARPRRVVVFRALQLGDMLCAIPALRALRATVPDAHVALVGLPSMRGFAARYPRYVDEYVDFPGMSGMPEQPARDDEIPAFVDDLRARGFDLAIQLHGDGPATNALVRRFGAAISAGFCRAADAAGLDPSCHHCRGTRMHRSRRARLALMARLGADADAVADASLELPVSPAERDEWRALAVEHRLRPSGFVCVHPGARWSSRRWPVERFVAVAARLAGRGLRIVVTGSDDERLLAAALVDALAARGVAAVDLAARTSLGALAAMLGDAALLVCNDTGTLARRGGGPRAERRRRVGQRCRTVGAARPRAPSRARARRAVPPVHVPRLPDRPSLLDRPSRPGRSSTRRFAQLGLAAFDHAA